MVRPGAYQQLRKIFQRPKVRVKVGFFSEILSVLVSGKPIFFNFCLLVIYFASFLGPDSNRAKLRFAVISSLGSLFKKERL